jgi:hypothetical protein
MSSIQIAESYRRIPLPLVAGLVAVAFALGALTGFGLPRIVAGASHATAAAVASQAVKGGPEHTMSDAAYQALHPLAVRTPLAGVVEHTMSDAAYEALRRSVPMVGTAEHTMSDAAYQALHRPPERTMSDAAYEALHHPSTPP